MIFWFFGTFVIGSLFIFATFTRLAWAHRLPLSIYNAVLMLGVSLDVIAFSLAYSSGVRLNDFLRGNSFYSVTPAHLYIAYILMVLGKTALVWVAALKGGRTYSKPIWWGYLATLAAWTIGVLAI